MNHLFYIKQVCWVVVHCHGPSAWATPPKWDGKPATVIYQHCVTKPPHHHYLVSCTCFKFLTLTFSPLIIFFKFTNTFWSNHVLSKKKHKRGYVAICKLADLPMTQFWSTDSTPMQTTFPYANEVEAVPCLQVGFVLYKHMHISISSVS